MPSTKLNRSKALSTWLVRQRDGGLVDESRRSSVVLLCKGVFAVLGLGNSQNRGRRSSYLCAIFLFITNFSLFLLLSFFGLLQKIVRFAPITRRLKVLIDVFVLV